MPEQGARALFAGRRSSPRSDDAEHAAGDRQLRLVHLQPRPVPRRARRGRRRAPQRRDDGRAQVAAMKPAAASSSRPGPGRPAEAGVSVDVVRRFAASGCPLLGVCLGHQCDREAFGGDIVRARDASCTARPRRSSTTGAACSRGLPEPVRRDALPLAGDRRATRARTARGHGAGPPTARSWACATARCRSRACSSIPSRSSPREGKKLLENFLKVEC